MRGFVYLINEYNDNNHYKIGVTTGTIENRMKKLQTGNSNELVITSYFQTNYPFKLEKMLHLYYNKNKIINEWFELSDDEVLGFKDICKKFNYTIEFMIKENPFYN